MGASNQRKGVIFFMASQIQGFGSLHFFGRYASSRSKVPLQPWFMLLCMESNTAHSAGVALCGDHRMVNLVLPSRSSKVATESNSNGQFGDMGWRVMPPEGSE